MGEVARRKLRWKTVFLTCILMFNIAVFPLPIKKSQKTDVVEDSNNVEDSNKVEVFNNVEVNSVDNIKPHIIEDSNNVTEPINDVQIKLNNETISHEGFLMTSDLRPGLAVNSYDIDITIDGDSFNGKVIIAVTIVDSGTRGDSIKFYCEDLSIDSVHFGLLNLNNPIPIDDFDVSGGVLEIEPSIVSSSYTFLIEYSGVVRDDGFGIYRRHYDNKSYVAMNLHPTHARRVFPCLDEPTQSTIISFTFHYGDHSQIVGNSINEGDRGEAEFEALQGPPHLWGIVAHDFNSVNIPGHPLRMYGRVANQGSYAQMMLGNLFTFLNEWTEKPFDEIDEMQDGFLHVFAMPDITRDWYALSTVALWEPNVFMEDDHSVKQQLNSLTAMSKGLARQWFGYVIYPQNWKYAWVTEGLAMYSAYKAAEESDDGLDFDSIFLADVIQESMLRDSFSDSHELEPEDELFEEDEIRDHLNGILEHKAPALLKMLNNLLGEDDYIELASKDLLQHRALQDVTDNHFYDSIHSVWLIPDNDDQLIDNVAEFLEPWIHNTGFPVINIEIRTGGLFITQERFGFTARDYVLYDIPLTYTTSDDPDFDDLTPKLLMGTTTTLDLNLNNGEWIVFNIQGQGYYRVKYPEQLWENLIEVLEDEEEREIIPHLNRAAILDDALNLARANKESYEIALQIALTMEFELDYAPWKAFVRNMNFLKKQLLAYVAEDDDLDPDIYLRMVRRAIVTFEEEIGFHPDPIINEDQMVILTRGLVMEHACRVKYDKCIAAANDWFFDPDSDDIALNENIPPEIRPAVYCVMVREAEENEEEEIIEVLWEQFEEEESMYERIVILKSFACSNDDEFIYKLLEETLDEDGRFGVEERAIFFEAVADSSLENAKVALEFIMRNVNSIRDMYGGPDRLERIIHTLADNLVTEDTVERFRGFVEGRYSELDDSTDSATRALQKAVENLEWRNAHLEEVYEWIDENGSSSLSISLIMISIMFIVHIFNR